MSKSTDKPKIELVFDSSGMGYWYGLYVVNPFDDQGRVLVWSYSATEGPPNEEMMRVIQTFMSWGAVTVDDDSLPEFAGLLDRILPVMKLPKRDET